LPLIWSVWEHQKLHDAPAHCNAVKPLVAAEKLIDVSLKSLFPKEPVRTVEMLDRLDEEYRRKTLGYFIRALRERIGSR
jgi:hypothetical protein